MSASPLPSTPNYIAETRQSCHDLSITLGLTPNLAAIDVFLLSLDQTTFDRLRTQHGLAFPLRFPTPTAEINFLALLALLNAFSGYRAAFHKATGIGAYQNVVRLMMGLYISSGEEDRVVGASALTANGMVALTEAKVVELLGVSVHEEREHETLKGVTVGVRGGDMLDAVQLILRTLQNVGKALLAAGHPSLGAYLVHLLQDTKSRNLTDEQAADHLVQQLATTFAEFRDTHHLPGPNKDVFLFKRIFFLLHSLHLKFGAREDFHIPDTMRVLPMFVDNVLPTMCVWFELLSVPATAPAGMETLYDWMASAHQHGDLDRAKLEGMQKNTEGPKLTVDEAYAVRAATLNVGSVVVDRARVLAKEQGRGWLEQLNEVDLDGYLWAVAKDDAALRKVPRFRFDTVHF
ncbi:uncharacterized protein SRS1_15476 [Sporisorium reilianum f. sp. reilianum]|uniref:Queuosine 5'-phosphate N-glycosylase/hydrolase n=1 Tax=Sporisorium reilianum f. sp. reilianum TaxID=72559 RepID=A0A2N8UIR1_9BASI|nr:uncharacterized protein SRS1_15476 [Sporisorium reilianum f. sp. reilianum]